MTAFDWPRMLLDDHPLAFLGEVMVRTLLAYAVVFIFLKVAGRRGVKQLSLFELVVILTLGSAAGDVTFYHDVPILPVLMVFVAMGIAYRLTTRLLSRYHHLQRWLEGEPFILIRDGRFELETLNKGNIAHDEFLMELRQGGVEHLGQVRLGIVEINGGVSLYFYEKDETRPGLPVLPPSLKAVHRQPEHDGLHACFHCGELATLRAGQGLACPRCSEECWVQALSNTRA